MLLVAGEENCMYAAGVVDGWVMQLPSAAAEFVSFSDPARLSVAAANEGLVWSGVN